MSQRVRCKNCQTAFLTTEVRPGQPVDCPKCGARHRIPEIAPREEEVLPDAEEPIDSAPANVFVPSDDVQARARKRRRLIVLGSLAILILAGVAALVAWPKVQPRKLDAVEKVAEGYLNALTKGDAEAQRRLSTVEEPPAIRSFQDVRHGRERDRTVKGSFAPLAALHARIDREFNFDPAIGRFTPKNPLGAAAETLDAVQAAKEEAQKSGIYEKMASGDPDDIFDAAENFGKVFTKLAEGVLAPKKILPTYKMLVDDAKPPIAPAAKELATHVAEHPKEWDALLRRPFHTLKPDGPFLFDQAEVDVKVTDRLASLGDPPTTLRLNLVRFRLEGIDTGWRVISARRILPGEPEESPPSPGETNSQAGSSPSGTDEPPARRSLGDQPPPVSPPRP
jgi:hypothetical protein